MAKKKVDPEEKLRAFHASVAEQRQADHGRLIAKYGESVISTPEIGLYLPYACLRYVFRMNVLPCCRFYQIYGPPASCKSAFLYWLYQFVVYNRGYYYHIEVEDKDQVTLRRAVVRPPAHIDDTKWQMRAEDLNMYQVGYYNILKLFKDYCEAQDVGRTIPLVVGIDSLAAKLPEETQRAFASGEDGATARRFGDTAWHISHWLKMATNSLHGWPFYGVGVNHDKPSKNKQGHNVHLASGGYAPEFMSTTRVRMEKRGDVRRTADGREGRRVNLKVDKNSAAPGNEEIEVEFLWQFTQDPETGQPVEVAWFDWHKATVQMLDEVREAKGARGKNLHELLGLKNCGDGVWACRALGVSPGDKQGAAEVGAALEANAELITQVDQILEVSRYAVFTPGVTDMADVLQARA